MMRTFLIAATVAGAALTAMSPANAAQGCGTGFHRGPYGGCNHPNRGTVYYAGPRGPAVGGYYGGRGYWDGHRYWHERYRYEGGWRYR